MVAIKGRKSSSKNPPILSHEFVIQNHADIFSCVAMVFVIGLMIQATTPWAYMFITLQHNVTNMIAMEGNVMPSPMKYTNGWKDACAVFFYFLMSIVLHAVIQEYLFDKISKRLRLSKSKLSKFNESSQLAVFYALSIIWAIDIVIRENFIPNVYSLWNDYPAPMSFSLKLFYIGQLSYWIHCYPELYFQRAKKEEIPSRIFQATMGLMFTLVSYVLNFQQVGVILIALNHTGECVMHGAKLIYFMDQKEKASKTAFFFANGIYMAVRLLSVLLSALVFVYGFSQLDDVLSINDGRFNIPAVRFSAFGAVLLFQLYLSYVFMNNQRKRLPEVEPPAQKAKLVKQKSKKKEASKKSGGSEDDAESDQGAKKNLRSRPAAAKTK